MAVSSAHEVGVAIERASGPFSGPLVAIAEYRMRHHAAVCDSRQLLSVALSTGLETLHQRTPVCCVSVASMSGCERWSHCSLGDGAGFRGLRRDRRHGTLSLAGCDFPYVAGRGDAGLQCTFHVSDELVAAVLAGEMQAADSLRQDRADSGDLSGSGE